MRIYLLYTSKTSKRFKLLAWVLALVLREEHSSYQIKFNFSAYFRLVNLKVQGVYLQVEPKKNKKI